MAITLPLPVRVAAGILGAGIDLLRALPDDIPAIPVTLVGNAMRLSMKVQQEIATLATRGDELLGGVIGAPQENPAWAKFDDDEPVKSVTPIRPTARKGPATGAGPKTASRPGPAVVVPKPTQSKSPGRDEKAPVGTPPGPADTALATAELATDDAPAMLETEPAPALTTPETTAMPPVTTTAMEAAIEVPQSVIDSATVAAEDAALRDPAPADAAVLDSALLDAARDTNAAITDLNDDEALVELAIDAVPDSTEPADADQPSIVLPSELTDGPEPPVIFEETEELTAGLPIPEELIEEVEAAADGPAALPDYDRMTLAQVRGHLRELSSEDVSALLRYEQDGDNRAPFLTLLSNRLVTLDAKQQ